MCLAGLFFSRQQVNAAQLCCDEMRLSHETAKPEPQVGGYCVRVSLATDRTLTGNAVSLSDTDASIADAYGLRAQYYSIAHKRRTVRVCLDAWNGPFPRKKWRYSDSSSPESFGRVRTASDRGVSPSKSIWRL